MMEIGVGLTTMALGGAGIGIGLVFGGFMRGYAINTEGRRRVI
jgi:F0F1-type ATP synthase membrane subunit c/vacuolar-type H+-ATPase subunit K